jgi:hypothetical protein
MASIFSLQVPPPKPSIKSANPSSCKAPVSNTLDNIVNTIATDGEKTKLEAYSVSVITPAVSHPDKGQYATMFLKYSLGTLATFHRGSLVKNIIAASI